MFIHCMLTLLCYVYVLYVCVFNHNDLGCLGMAAALLRPIRIGNFPESLSQRILVGRILVGRLGVRRVVSLTQPLVKVSLPEFTHPHPLLWPWYYIFSGVVHIDRPCRALKTCHTGGSVVGVRVVILVLKVPLSRCGISRSKGTPRKRMSVGSTLYLCHCYLLHFWMLCISCLFA